MLEQINSLELYQLKLPTLAFVLVQVVCSKLIHDLCPCHPSTTLMAHHKCKVTSMLTYFTPYACPRYIVFINPKYEVNNI